MAEQDSTTKHPLKSKWVDDQGHILNWVEYAKEQGWITEGKEFKRYLRYALMDMGSTPTAEFILTDGKPLATDGSLAILIDRNKHCWVRQARVEDKQIIVTSPLWPYGEVPFPLENFEIIERVHLISLGSAK